MGARNGMRAVELEEPNGAPDPVDRPSAPSRRRPLVLGAAVVGVVALLVAGQAVVSSRHRAAVAALDGVLHRLDAAPRVLWTFPAGGGVAWRGPLGKDGVAELRLTEDGSQELVALDAGSGDVRWSTTLTGPSPDRVAALVSGDGVMTSSTCTSPPGSSSTLACLVTDGFVDSRTTTDGPQATVHQATSTTVQVVDGSDGSVISQWPATGSALLAPSPDLVVVARSTDRGAEVDGFRLSTGASVWSADVPATVPELQDAANTVHLLSAGPFVAVTGPAVGGILDRSGTVIRTDAVIPSGNGSLETVGDGRFALRMGSEPGGTELLDLGPDPHDITLFGTPVGFGVDDGSLPGLLLTSGSGLWGWDATTGKGRWKVPDLEQTGSDAVVLDRSIYVATTSGVVAIDGTDGTVRWTIPLSTDYKGIRTDGRHVIVVGSDGSGAVVVSAHAVDDGHEIWHSGDVGQASVKSIGRRLYAVGADGSLSALG